MTPEGIEQIREPGERMQICAFLWVYYGYPNSVYEGVSVEEMRYRNGAMIAKRDENRDELDYAAGVPDSGTAHAIGYANEARIHFERPFIKYTPTWPRSFMPTNQSVREMIARMKLVPVDGLIQDKDGVDRRFDRKRYTAQRYDKISLQQRCKKSARKGSMSTYHVCM